MMIPSISQRKNDAHRNIVVPTNASELSMALEDSETKPSALLSDEVAASGTSSLGWSAGEVAEDTHSALSTPEESCPDGTLRGNTHSRVLPNDILSMMFPIAPFAARLHFFETMINMKRSVCASCICYAVIDP